MTKLRTSGTLMFPFFFFFNFFNALSRQEPMDDNMDGDGDLYAELEEARNQQKGVLDDEEEKEVKEKKDEDLLMDLGIVEMREDIMDDDLAMPEPLNVNSEIEPSERQVKREKNAENLF